MSLWVVSNIRTGPNIRVGPNNYAVVHFDWLGVDLEINLEQEDYYRKIRKISIQTEKRREISINFEFANFTISCFLDLFITRSGVTSLIKCDGSGLCGNEAKWRAFACRRFVQTACHSDTCWCNLVPIPRNFGTFSMTQSSYSYRTDSRFANERCQFDSLETLMSWISGVKPKQA